FGMADDGGDDANGGGGQRGIAEGDLADIVEGVDAGPDLGDAGHVGNVTRRGGGTERDNGQRHTAGTNCLGHVDHQGGCSAGLAGEIGLVAGAVGGAFVGVDADEFDAGQRVNGRA